MEALNVDLLVLGSSLSSLVAIQDSSVRQLSILVIDIKPRIGGLLSTITTVAGSISLVPIVTPPSTSVAQGLALRSKLIVLKEGDYESKVHGYEAPNLYQGSWFVTWRKLFNAPEVKIVTDSSTVLPKLAKPRIVTNIRRIDAEKRVALLSNGLVIKYRALLSSWPLDTLLTRLSTIPKACRSLQTNLRSVPIHVSIIVEESSNVDEDEVLMYVHETKASRFHTAIKIARGNYAVTYVFTSYSSRYPLMPGIIEKIFSEMRKFRIVDERKIVDERHYSYLYASLSRVDDVHQCINELLDENIVCTGRLGLWHESSLSDLMHYGREAVAKTREIL